jgi:hypothetical protein
MPSWLRFRIILCHLGLDDFGLILESSPLWLFRIAYLPPLGNHHKLEKSLKKCLNKTPKMGMTKVYSSVVRFFFFKRTSDPALTFKTLCEGS